MEDIPCLSELSTLPIRKRKTRFMPSFLSFPWRCSDGRMDNLSINRKNAGGISEIREAKEYCNEFRSIITAVSLTASGITDSPMPCHLQNARNHGVTKEEIDAIITHATMYAGWLKGWAVFRLAKEIGNNRRAATCLLWN